MSPRRPQPSPVYVPQRLRPALERLAARRGEGRAEAAAAALEAGLEALGVEVEREWLASRERALRAEARRIRQGVQGLGRALVS